MASRWPEFDRLLHELGAISAFKTEAAQEAVLAGRHELAELVRSVEQAAAAIGRITEQAEDEVMLRAWTALARARNAMDAVRSVLMAAQQASRRGLAS